MKRISALLLALLMAFSLIACGNDKNEDTTPTIKQDLQMADVYDKLSAAAQIPEMLQLQESMMLDYCGIDAAKTKQAVVMICADSLRTDEIWLLEAVDEAAAKELADAGAAVYVEEATLSEGTLTRAMRELLENPTRIAHMKAAISRFAVADANDQIWQKIKELTQKQS